MYIGVTKEMRKEWEKEITEETEGGKTKRNKIIRKIVRKEEEA